MQILLVLLLVAHLALAPGSSLPDPARTRQAFLRIVQPRPCPLAPERIRQEGQAGFRKEKVIIQSEPGRQVAMLTVERDEPGGRRPVVIVLHGTNGRKEAHEALLYELASRGYLAVAPDARYHGEFATRPYESVVIDAWRSKRGHPWLYETVTDTIRVLDYLETRPDVDARRIGMIGFSMGGMNTWLTAAADPRVAVAVPCIGVTSFGYQYRTGDFLPRVNTLRRFHDAVRIDLGESRINSRVVRAAWDQVLPGIMDEFDCPNMLAAIAPRPLLILNGEIDARCPLPGVAYCVETAQAAYSRAKAAHRLKLHIAQDTGHRVTPEQQEMALAWFDQWLTPAAARDSR